MTTKLSANFTLEEMCASSTATAKGIKNVPNATQLANLKETCKYLLQPIRNFYGKAIHINSGFRSEKLNTAIGGSKTSSHMCGLAADIKPTDGNMRAMQRSILEWAKINNFDQIIIEQPINYVATWIHVGWRRGTNNVQRRQILGAKKVNGKWSYYVIDQKSKYYAV